MRKINYPLIVSDFDGTLVKKDGTIDEDNKKAIAEYIAAGGAFAISTGRLPVGILPRARELGLKGMVSCCQGAIILDIESGKAISEGRLPYETTLAVVEKMEQMDLHIHVYDDWDYYANKDDDALKFYEAAVRVKAKRVTDKPMSQFIREKKLGSYKILAMVPAEDNEKILGELAKENFEGCELTKSDEFLVEVINAKYSKGTAVEFLANYYGAPLEKTVAIGDQLNDLPMIEKAGLGVAVKNADERLKACADYVAEYTNEEGAVGRIIEKFGFQSKTMLEILAPAGNTECAEAAINSGADAIYLGLNAFSARQSAGNFDGEALCALLQKAHFCGVRVYVAMNTLVKDEELKEFFESLLFAWNAGADAIILQDIFLGKLVHEKYPKIVLHLSTQAGVCNAYGAEFAKKCGFSRVILARETPLEEIKKITKIIETEVFVQGALCTSYSGQCYFSSFAGGNSGNRGRCKQPCRKLYSYDRNGNTEKSYALSLSDLCVGEDIEKLINGGVVSFKIEGRMRRKEYVAAAVRYYRILLDGKQGKEGALSDLKRTYNRGNYTKGLAFGQDKRFLSTAIQGHIGEKVGVVKVVNGKFFVESKFIPKQGDAFKILREGREVGGASFSKAEGRGFVLFSKHRLKNGDGVFITTDTSVNERVLQGERKGKIHLILSFKVGEKALVEGGGVCVYSEEALESAANRPLRVDELKACFLKTGGLPVEVEFEKIELCGNIFIPKSMLNALRRSFYAALSEKVAKNDRAEYVYEPVSFPAFTGKNEKTAVIASDFSDVKADIAIYKPDDFRLALPQSFIDGKFEKYLFIPAFCTWADMQTLYEKANGFIDGVYIENYGGIAFAQERNLKIFAGTGLNLFNQLSVNAFLSEKNAAYYAISKEANIGEGNALAGEKGFVLSSGNIKLMELCYCPFGKSCGVCDNKPVYSLTDENGRAFPVKRYLAADGSCRFEVYNCAELISAGLKNVGKLLDLTLVCEKGTASLADTEEKQKEIYENYTSGHFKRGVL